MLVWCDQKEVIHQSHQTPAEHKESKITATVNQIKSTERAPSSAHDGYICIQAGAD